MRGRRGSASIAANPVLIGAATTLVVIVAVFLAYNANTGLPFVPTYQLDVRVPNAANLVKGNEVRVGGTRVGIVNDIQANLDLFWSLYHSLYVSQLYLTAGHGRVVMPVISGSPLRVVCRVRAS